MNNGHLRRLIIFGSIVLAGLMTVQIYWFKQAFDVSEKQLDHRVQIAIMRVADSVSTGAKVSKLSRNFFFVNSETNFDNNVIDSLVRTEFERIDPSLDYELGVYKAEDDTLVYGYYVEATRAARLEQEMAEMADNGSLKNFAIYIPRKSNYILANLDIWVFSTIALLMMMGFFAWSIATLLKERRFAELKNDFINNMTHEFKTPVTNIGIAHEILLKKIPPDSGCEPYLSIVAKENEKLLNKIEKVLLGASIDKRNPILERIDVHQIILECAESFRFKVLEREGALRLQLDATNRFVLGDRELLSQAINNIIDNAEKYSLSRPEIVVMTTDTDNAIEIVVRDKGIGIPEKMHSKVFGKFFRIRNGDIHNVKGFGLGLSFVKTVIQSHRGSIDLLSKVNQGTEVRITLPQT